MWERSLANANPLLSAETLQKTVILMNCIQTKVSNAAVLILPIWFFILRSRKLDLVELAFQRQALLLPVFNVPFHTDALYPTKEMG